MGRCGIAAQSERDATPGLDASRWGITWDAKKRCHSVTRPKTAALDSTGHGRLRGRTLAQWGKDRISEAEWAGG